MSNLFLLTFDRLPNRQLVGEDSLFTQAYERLDSTSTFFEQHYLQQPGADSIFGNSVIVAELETAIADKQVAAKMVFLDGAEKEFLDGRSLPVGFQHAAVSTLPQPQAEASTNQIVWVHSDLKSDHSEAENVAKFEQCLAWCREQTTTTNSALIVTSVEGHQALDPPFESVLFEGSVKVPLWIEQPTKQASRLQCPTGSFDILQTALNWTRAPEEQPSFSSEPIRNSISLLGLLRQSGEYPKRTINIRTQSTTALRTDEFMFCQNITDQEVLEDDISQVALYTKPEDVWNINNVASEYHDLVQDFQSQLPKSV